MRKFLTSMGMALAVTFAVPAVAAEEFVGNDAIPASQVDSCNICTFIVNQAFPVAGQGVTSFEFYANRVGTITPFLSTRIDTGSNANFTITAIGQERNAGLGFNIFDFGAVSGSNITSANTFFGFAYNSGSNGGVVAFEYSGSGLGTFIAPGNTFPTQGGTFSSSFGSQQMDALGALNNRIYSISATANDAIAAVPEPATWALMLLGFGVVGTTLRRRRKVLATARLA